MMEIENPFKTFHNVDELQETQGMLRLVKVLDEVIKMLPAALVLPNIDMECRCDIVYSSLWRASILGSDRTRRF